MIFDILLKTDEYSCEVTLSTDFCSSRSLSDCYNYIQTSLQSVVFVGLFSVILTVSIVEL